MSGRRQDCHESAGVGGPATGSCAACARGRGRVRIRHPCVRFATLPDRERAISDIQTVRLRQSEVVYVAVVPLAAINTLAWRLRRAELLFLIWIPFMRPALPRLTLLCIALSLASLSHAADKVVGSGENADTGSRSVLVPSGVSAGVIDTGSGDVFLQTGAVTRNIDTGSGQVELAAGASAGRIDTGSGSVRLGNNTQAGAIDTGSGGIEIGSDVHVEGIDTGSGDVRGGDRVIVDGRIDTGSGSVSFGAGSSIRGDIDTGSGSVRLGAGSAVSGGIDTGSGEVQIEGTRVGGKVDTGSGDITLADSRVDGDLATSTGRVTLSGNSVVTGDLIVRKSKCWGLCWGNDRPTRIVIGASASVIGEIRIEREAELWVHETARIGRVSGAQVQRFSGERP